MNRPTRQVHVEPGEIENLALSHSCMNGRRDDPLGPFPTLKRRKQICLLVESQIARPSAVRAKFPHSPTRIAFNQLSIKGQRENFGQDTKLPVNSHRMTLSPIHGYSLKPLLLELL